MAEHQEGGCGVAVICGIAVVLMIVVIYMVWQGTK